MADVRLAKRRRYARQPALGAVEDSQRGRQSLRRIFQGLAQWDWQLPSWWKLEDDLFSTLLASTATSNSNPRVLQTAESAFLADFRSGCGE